MRGDRVTLYDGTEVTLVDIGTTCLMDNEVIRVWDVSLPGNAVHPWHLHHNPYVVLSLTDAEGRMDWFDGAEPRHIKEFRGEVVCRPIAKIHRLTNLRDTSYRNRLIELKTIGELRPEGVLDIGPGGRSTPGEEPTGVEATDDGRRPVYGNELVRVWTIDVEAGQSVDLTLEGAPQIQHVIAELDPDYEGGDLHNSVSLTAEAAHRLTNDTDRTRTWFVVALDYLTEHPAERTSDE